MGCCHSYSNGRHDVENPGELYFFAYKRIYLLFRERLIDMTIEKALKHIRTVVKSLWIHADQSKMVSDLLDFLDKMIEAVEAATRGEEDEN